MATGQKSPLGKRHKNHGGVRPNSGRKKDVLSVSQLKRMLDEEAKMEESEGISLNQILLNMAHGKKFDVGEEKEITPAHSNISCNNNL